MAGSGNLDSPIRRLLQHCEAHADHGELLEAAAVASAPAAPTGSITPAARAAGHEHCIFDAVFHQAATGQPASPAATSVATAAVATAPPVAAPPPRADIYRFAP